MQGKAELAGDIAGFAAAVSTRAATAGTRGYALHQKLFGQLEPGLRDKPRWILALDEQLFQVPFAALVAGGNAEKPVYLAERHSLRVTTGVLRLVQDHPASWRSDVSGRFLGNGHRNERLAVLPWLAWAATPAHGLMLARLAGVARFS